MRRRHLPLLVLLASASACRDVPLTPPAPDAPGSDTPTPMAVGSVGWSDIGSGYDYLCALGSGKVYCFGEGDHGQPIGEHVAATGTFVQLSTGAEHACALRSDGAVECWGVNDFGEAPAVRRAATGVYLSVSAGLGHTCALRTGGTVECWGSNDVGQAPSVVTPQTGRFKEVSASASSTCALRSDGAIECWGFYKTAKLPVRTAPFGTYVKLARSVGATNCALTSTGVADCWGYQEGWRAGPYVQVAVGGSHVCAIRADGSTDCWGYSPYWEGPGERSATTEAFAEVSPGYYHTCGLRADGYFECFGLQTMGSDDPRLAPLAETPTATQTGALRVRVTWRDISTNELRTELERSPADAGGVATTWTRIATLSTNVVGYTDNVSSNATYLYRIRTCNLAGCSEWETAYPVEVTG